MADPRGSNSSGYLQTPYEEGGAGNAALPTNQTHAYYQTAPSQYVAPGPGPNIPMYSSPPNINSSYPSIGAQNQRSMYPPGYLPPFGTASMYPSGAQTQNTVYNANALQMPYYADSRSLPRGPGVGAFPQPTSTPYSTVAPHNVDPSPWGPVQSSPATNYRANAQPPTSSGWYATGPQNTNFGYHATGQYPTGVPYMPSPQVQPGNFVPTAPNTNYSGLSTPSAPSQDLAIGIFVLYSPRRLAFAETSGRGAGAVQYKRPCLIHDKSTDSVGTPSFWVVPVTGAYKGQRKLGMTPNWWQPVKWHTNMADAPTVPADQCVITTSSGAQVSYRDRKPIPLYYTPPPPGRTRTELQDKIPELKPDYIWVGDIGEAIPLTDTARLNVLRLSVISPYYSTSTQTITELHSEMLYWKYNDLPPQLAEDRVPRGWGSDYPPPPPPRG